MKSRPVRRAAAFCVFVFAAAGASPPPGLDRWIARAQREFEVPGVAVAIVKDGAVVHAKGYGVRKLGDPRPVDEHTLFGIASNTKAFTAAALAILVDEGKVAWDDPVQKHIPSFQLYDPYASRELTVRDALCHRSGLGLGAGDLLFWPDTSVTRGEVVAAARHIRPASSFRSRYAYNNLMFVVAGEIVASAARMSWDEFVRSRILAPLGMRETVIGAAGYHGGENAAIPHSRGWRLQGAPLRPIAPTRDETWAAAAGIRSSVADLSRWVLAHLNGGAAGGRPLWSASAAREMWSPQTLQTVSDPPAALKNTKANFAAYGLGWGLRDYHGRKVVSHGGALTGMVSAVFLIPEERLGVIVLTNQEENGAVSSIVYSVADHYLKREPTDWIAAFRSTRDERLKKAADEECRLEAGRAVNSRPSLDLDRYSGEYTDAWYGKARIGRQDGKLVLSFSRTAAMAAVLEHWQYDTFRAVFGDPTIPDAFVTFAVDYKGSVSQFTMTAVSPIADFSFDYHDLLFRRGPAAPAGLH